MRLGNPDEAERFFERALAGEPVPPEGVIDTMVEARLGLARTLRDRERACRLAQEASARVEFPRPTLAPESRRLVAACK